MRQQIPLSQILTRLFCLIYPVIWLNLPNLLIIFINPDIAFKLATLGLILTVLCCAPFLLVISKNLRQFWLWNLPFAMIAGIYAGYIIQYHDIPYDGIWFAIWTASLDVDFGMIHFFWNDILKDFLGFVIYVLCLLHPAQKQIRISTHVKQVTSLISLVIVATTLNIMHFFSGRVPIQRMIDLSVITKSYPYGMVAMCIKTAISATHQKQFALAPMKRKAIPKGREIYVFVIGEAARRGDWTDVSQRMNSSLLTDPDIRIFKDAISQANLTGYSLPLILTGTSTLQSALNQPTWVEFARAAGCKTGWITNSTEPFKYAYNSNFYDLNFDHSGLMGVTAVIYDDVLIPEVERAIAQGPEKLCLVVHLIGSHFDYRERYRADHARFTVNNAAFNDMSSPEHTEALHNAFKNSLIETNILLQNILAILKQQNATSVLIYAPDHAESFNDYNDQQNFHGNLRPHKIEMEIPFFIWTNKKFQSTYPGKWKSLTQNQSRKISNRQLLPTLLDILDVENLPGNLSPSLFQAYQKDEKRWILLPSAKLVDFESLGS